MAIIDKPSDFFNIVLYTGNGGTQTISGVGFQPDFVWGKGRTSTEYHQLYDAVRSATKVIFSTTDDAEETKSAGLTAFNSDGFVLGSDDGLNKNTISQVAWNWKAGTSFSNSAGANGASIASTGSINTTAGFSIIKYTGSGSNATIAHGLGVVPKMIIFKNLSSAVDWRVYHTALGNTNRLCLNDTSASNNDDSAFNDTSPTSTVFSVGGSSSTNAGTMIAYCFAEKQGYSKFGSYIGNGNANGPFVYTGFKPAFVMVKRTDATGDWHMADNKRLGYNPDQNDLFANLSNAEDSGNFTNILSNGFKLINSEATHNGSGNSFIYMAFAENPFVASNFNPATAR